MSTAHLYTLCLMLQMMSLTPAPSSLHSHRPTDTVTSNPPQSQAWGTTRIFYKQLFHDDYRCNSIGDHFLSTEKGREAFHINKQIHRPQNIRMYDNSKHWCWEAEGLRKAQKQSIDEIAETNSSHCVLTRCHTFSFKQQIYFQSTHKGFCFIYLCVLC